MAFLPFVLRRAGRQWQLLVTLVLGTVLATALMASGPLLVHRVTEMGLHLTLQSSGVADGNLRLTASGGTDQTDFLALDSELQTLLRSALGEHLGSVTRSAQSGWTFPWAGDQLVTNQRVNLRFYEGIQDRVEYVAGRWPETASGDVNVIRAVVSEGMVRSFALRVGDRIPVSLSQNSTEPNAWIEVTGVVRPQNPRDPYWFGEFSPLTVQTTERWAAQYSAIVPLDTFFPAV